MKKEEREQLSELRNEIYYASHTIRGTYSPRMFGTKFLEIDKAHEEIVEKLQAYENLLEQTLKTP